MGCFPNGKIISVLFPNSNKLVNLRKKKKTGRVINLFLRERKSRVGQYMVCQTAMSLQEWKDKKIFDINLFVFI